MSYLQFERNQVARDALAQLLDRIKGRLLYIRKESAARTVVHYLRMAEENVLKCINGNEPAGHFTSSDELDPYLQQCRQENENFIGEVLQQIGIMSLHEEQGTRARLDLDPVSIILREYGHIGADSVPTMARLLYSRFPAFMQLDHVQLELLKTLHARRYAKEPIEEHSKDDAQGTRIALARALVAALYGDWKMSERLAGRARESTLRDKERDLEREALYWCAISKRHQENPGLSKLTSAADDLRQAARLTQENSINAMRIRTEEIGLDLATYYHSYYYPGEYGDLRLDFAMLLEQLETLGNQFIRTVRTPYDAITARLGTQIFANIGFLALLSYGLPPSIPAELRWGACRFRSHYISLDHILTTRERTGRQVSGYLSLLRLALKYVFEGRDAARRDEIKKLIRKLFKRMKRDRLISLYDQKKIGDFLEVANEEMYRRFWGHEM